MSAARGADSHESSLPHCSATMSSPSSAASGTSYLPRPAPISRHTDSCTWWRDARRCSAHITRSVPTGAVLGRGPLSLPRAPCRDAHARTRATASPRCAPPPRSRARMAARTRSSPNASRGCGGLSGGGASSSTAVAVDSTWGGERAASVSGGSHGGRGGAKPMPTTAGRGGLRAPRMAGSDNPVTAPAWVPRRPVLADRLARGLGDAP